MPAWAQVAISAAGAAASAHNSKKAAEKGDYSGYKGTVFDKILSILPQSNQENSYLNTAEAYTNNILSDDYSAISKADRQRMYDERASDAQTNIIKPQEDKLAARLAIRGLSDSAAGAGEWDDQSKSNKELLSDIYNDIEDKNIGYTQNNKSQAYSMLPTLSSLYSNNQNSQLNAWMQFANVLNGSGGSVQTNSADMAGWGQMLGNALSNVKWGKGGSGS